MNDARISMTRTRARFFDALYCLHPTFAESLYLSHSFEQLIKLWESTHSGLIWCANLCPVCPRSSSPFCDMSREIFYPDRSESVLEARFG
jgi:hypothetical protein